MAQAHILIMAGGVGSRLFPLSTPEHPKQFIDILETGKTLIQMTYERFLAVNPQARFWILTSEKYIHFIHEQLPGIPDEQILAEPMARNTAPCISYACRKIAAKYPDATVVITPSDAYVPDHSAFAATIHTAMDYAARQDALLCIGIQPTRPDTGYGYIAQGAQMPALAGNGGTGQGGNAGSGVFKVQAFKEKPDEETAKRYLAEGGYFWNAGIFVWNVRSIEAELAAHAPGIEALISKVEPHFYTPSEQSVLEEYFPQCEKISIDYAVMEKSSKVYMVPGLWEWSDLGSFAAIDAAKRK